MHQYNSRGRYSSGTIYRRKPARPKTAIIPAGMQQVYNDLMSYSGSFPLLNNLRDSINRYGKLSDKQWAAAKKCLAPKTPNAATIQPANCNIPITVTVSAARRIGRANKWPINPCTFTVTQLISRRYGKTFKVRARIDWDTAVSVCRCCGRTLTDWRSQATGVGPVCVKRTNIPYVKTQADVAAFQQSMKTLVAQLGEVEFEVKSWHLINGESDLRNVVFTSSTTHATQVVSAAKAVIAANTPVSASIAATPTPPSIGSVVNPYIIFNIADCNWFETKRVLQVPPKVAAVRKDEIFYADSINIYNTQTDTQVCFKFSNIENNGKRFVFTNVERAIVLWVEIA